MERGSGAITPMNGKKQLPKILLITAKLLQVLSPSLAASFSIKLFRKPIRHPRPEREEMMANSAKVEVVDIPEVGQKIVVYSYGYSRRKVLMVHGWSGRGTQHFKIADKLLENGFMVVSFDGPAHGNATGKSTNLIEFIATTLYLQKNYGPFEAAIGHSFGGLAVLNSISRGLKLKKAVTIGCGDLISYFLEDLTAKLKLKPKVAVKMRQRISKNFGVDVDAFAGSEAAKKVTIPTFVVHDSTDKEVPVSCAMKIRQNLSKGRVLITNGLGHRRLLNEPYVINKIVSFIKN